MKKYIVCFVLLLSALIEVPITCTSVDTTSEKVHVKFDITIMNTAKLLESGVEEVVGLYFCRPIQQLIEDNEITILGDDVYWLPNGDVQYKFDAIIYFKRSHSLVKSCLLDIIIKNKTNNSILRKAIYEEVTYNPKQRSGAIKKWGNEIIRSLSDKLSNQQLNDTDLLYTLGMMYDLTNPEKTDIKIGSYLFDEFGCEIKLNEFVCEVGNFDPAQMKKSEGKPGATHLFATLQEREESNCDSCCYCLYDKR